MARDDGKPYGIAELRRRWPDKHAIAAIIKVPSGAYLSMSSDLPDALAAEVIGKVSWYWGEHEWEKWAPGKKPIDVCGCKGCVSAREKATAEEDPNKKR
jgi:hypothetical protein